MSGNAVIRDIRIGKSAFIPEPYRKHSKKLRFRYNILPQTAIKDMSHANLNPELPIIQPEPFNFYRFPTYFQKISIFQVPFA